MARIRFMICIALFAGLMLWASAAGAQEKWKALSIDINAKFITFDWLGNLYAIDDNDEMYYLGKRAAKWHALYPGAKVKYMNVFPDGTIMALHKTDSLGYKRVNGTWTTMPGMLKQTLVAKDGTQYGLTMEGRVTGNGKSFVGPYTHIVANMISGGIYLVGANNRIYHYDKSMSAPVEIIGNGLGKLVAGGTSTKAGQYILGAGTDANVYYYDIVAPSNTWTKVQSNLFMTFIAMKPDGKLYGIGTNKKIYTLSVPY